MGLQPWLSWRRTGVVATSLAVVLSTTAAAAPPATGHAAGDPAACVERAARHPAGPADLGGAHKHDSNDLTPAQVAQREREFAALLAQRPGASLVAQATVPVVFHIISTDGTRAGGDIPKSMIDAQIQVLNQSYGGAPAARRRRSSSSSPASAG